jgi:hypothetical protein
MLMQDRLQKWEPEPQKGDRMRPELRLDREALARKRNLTKNVEDSKIVNEYQFNGMKN